MTHFEESPAPERQYQPPPSPESSALEEHAGAPVGEWRIQHFSREFHEAFAQRDFTKALAAAEGACNAADRAENIPPVQFIGLLDNLARACLATGKFEQAEGAMLTALRLCDRVPGSHAQKYAAIEKLAQAYDGLDKSWLAEKMLIGAVKAGAADARSLDAELLLKAPVSQLWQFYRRSGEYGKAIAILEEGMEIYAHVWRNHPARVALMIGELGSLQLFAGDPQEALPHLLKAAGVCERQLGGEHSAMLTINTLIAGSLALQERWGEARAYIRKARSIEQFVDKSDSHVFELGKALAGEYDARGDRASYEKVVRLVTEAFKPQAAASVQTDPAGAAQPGPIAEETPALTAEPKSRLGKLIDWLKRFFQ